MLDLASPHWAELNHCYRPGDELPPLLAELYRVQPKDTWRFQDWHAEPLKQICACIVLQPALRRCTSQARGSCSRRRGRSPA